MTHLQRFMAFMGHNICHSKGHAKIDHTHMAIPLDPSETIYQGDPCMIHAHYMGRDHNGHLQQKQTNRTVICIFRSLFWL